MEIQEFDLNDYSLEVRDGKAVLERKEKEPQVFKPGDVLAHRTGAVVIYAGTDKLGGIVTYMGYWDETGVFSDKKDNGWGFTEEYSYATSRQKAMLFAEIEKRGYVWDAEKLELRRKYDFGDGEFLVDGKGYIFIHWKGGDSKNGLGSYLYWNPESDDMFIRRCSSVVDKASRATDKQKQRLLDRLAKEGLRWDAEKLKLRKKRWRARKDEYYWFVDSDGSVYKDTENFLLLDNSRYSLGNYFRTEQKAEKVRKDVIKVFQKQRRK